MAQQTESFNPATGDRIGFSDLHSVEDLKEMIVHSRDVQKKWEQLTIGKRVKQILRIRDFLIDNTDRIADTIFKDNGKTRIDAIATEVFPAAMALSYYCKNAKRFLSDKKNSGGNIILTNKRSKVIRVPFGVIGIISPWNYPFSIPFSEVIMGLLAGNAVILKTATETQMVGLILKEAIEYAGLPEGLFNFINLPGKIAGDAFIDCGLDKIYFTGSVSVGKYMMAKAASNLTPIVLELGGNDAMIVCEDADLYRAVNGAVWGGFQNAGQTCCGIERIYVHEKICDSFMKLFKQKIETLRVGYDADFNTDMGCMTTDRQIETVNRHVEDALKKGATIFAQSKIPADSKLKNFLPATVLTNVNHDMLAMCDETFGPVVGVMKFNDYTEAIGFANNSQLGLTGSVWTTDSNRGETIARQIKAGVVTINDHSVSHGMAETTWGGFKNSGIGRTHGRIGFEGMTQPVTIVHDILPFVKKDLWWHPFNKKIYDGLKGTMNLLYSRKLSSRLKGATSLLKIIPRIFKND